jgi:hypothetical protein
VRALGRAERRDLPRPDAPAQGWPGGAAQPWVRPGRPR